MSELKESRVRDWLRKAYGSDAGCPPPEAFHATQVGDLSRAEAEALEQHAAMCPACAAERDLVALFETDSDEITTPEVTTIAEALEQPSPLKVDTAASPTASGRRPSPDAPPAPDRGAPLSSMRERLLRALPPKPALAVAAAALVVVVTSVVVERFSGAPPELPSRTVTMPRGAIVEAISPIGDIAETPGGFRWRAVDTAIGYRVTVRAVDDSVLWEETVGEPEAIVPESLKESLQPHVLYTWRIVALDAAGKQVATSNRLSFRVVPRPG